AVVGILIRSVGLGVFAIMVDPWQAAIGGILFAAGGGLSMPPTQSIGTKSAADAVRGGVLGMFQSAQSLAIILGTAFAGVLFTVGPQVPNTVAFAVSVFSVIPALFIMRRMESKVESGV
ncbi:MAG: hypothetical protein M3094_09050, partial [Actinomycetia bacterium]|nr:hypothetical protein [Actinomycetes bacterium]